MAAAASSSSGGSFKYDVFINFRGEDTRRGFVCHLYEALKQKALDTFIDSEELRKGDDLSELLKAIQDSKLSIIVFSINYATSTWCLKELVQILECMDRQSQIVVPVFYDVDPSHIRKIKESFTEAFAKHESDSNLDKEELESWKSSLARATSFAGYHSKNYQDDSKLINSIVQDILEKLIRTFPNCKTDGLIGMDSHMDGIGSLLQLGVNDSRIVGIWGMGGIGKSTIARAAYENIGPQFDYKCFLENVKEAFLTKNGGLQMAEDLLCATLNIKDRSILARGLNTMRERLSKKKVLLVLDDVDDPDQIETLIGKRPSFGGGSRVIITTRDKKVLPECLIYEPKLFTTEEALELFCSYAFRRNRYSETYNDISRRAIEYAHGLPLALKVLGALLDNKTVEEWECELKKMEKLPIAFPDDKIGRVLRASYDGLDEREKNIFLDIACFFRGKRTEAVKRFHESCGFFPNTGLRVLIDKSLVTLSPGYDGDELEMHDLIQEMGRDIIRLESPKDPGARSRLWYYEDVLQVLAQNTEKEYSVEGIILDLSKSEEVCINSEAFVRIKNLRLLQLDECTSHGIWWPQLGESTSHLMCKQHVDGDLKFIWNELRVLVWHGCTLKSLPSSFQPNNLIKIDMRHSHIEQLWEGSNKSLSVLESMDLSSSKYLIKTHDFTLVTYLKELDLVGRRSLLEVHPSISALKSLVRLDLRCCRNLVRFPNISGSMKELKVIFLNETSITEMPSSINDLSALECLSLRNCRELRNLPSSIHMKNLIVLDLSGCSKLERFPEFSKVMKKLSVLGVAETAIKELPSFIGNLTKLTKLDITNCTSLVSLPDEIFYLVEELDLTGCSKLSKLPENFQNWESLGERNGRMGQFFFPSNLVLLDLSDCNLLELSDAIAHLASLETLKLCRNKNLESLPEAMNHLPHLSVLHLIDCTRLKSIPELPSSIQEIQAQNCRSLETVSTPQLPCDDVTRFTFLNCLKLENTDLFIDIVEADDNQVYALPINFQNHMSLPGSDNPDWFRHRCRGSSVTVQLPPNRHLNMFMGLAICAIINLRGADNRTALQSAYCHATFSTKDGHDNFYIPLSCLLNQIICFWDI